MRYRDHTTIASYIPDDLFYRIEDIRWRLRLTRSEIIRRALEDYIAKRGITRNTPGNGITQHGRNEYPDLSRFKEMLYAANNQDVNEAFKGIGYQVLDVVVGVADNYLREQQAKIDLAKLHYGS